jgi:DNA-binding CsgD family transcriptional regulator
MHGDVGQLSEREKEALRLLLRGHDAKSIARTLNLSIHTVNERLRDARRKLQVSSSREAARLLLEEDGPVQIAWDREIGVAAPARMVAKPARPALLAGNARPFIGGAFLMFLTSVVALGAYSMGQQASPKGSAEAAPVVTATTPAAGAIIAPGPFTLSVTFDLPMLEGYSFVQMSRETFPTCEPRVQFSADRRSFSQRCTALPGRHYEIWFNREPYMNFRSASGAAARPHQLLFQARK